MKMTPKEEKFCFEYARTGNATESYKAAGYKFKNYNCAGVSANRLLKKSKIQTRLQELAGELKQAKIADVTECQMILTEIARDKNQKGIVRVKAIENLLKAQGAFSTQINLTAVTPIVLRDDVNE